MKKIETTPGYPGQRFAGAYEYCNVYPADKKLEDYVALICFPYPFETCVSVINCYTWGELFKKIYNSFRKLYREDFKKNGEVYHWIGEYVVSGVTIYDNGVAVVDIDS